MGLKRQQELPFFFKTSQKKPNKSKREKEANAENNFGSILLHIGNLFLKVSLFSCRFLIKTIYKEKYKRWREKSIYIKHI